MIVFDIRKKFRDLVDCGLTATRLRRHRDQRLALELACPQAVLSIHKMVDSF
jgi:hypothetical protein